MEEDTQDFMDELTKIANFGNEEKLKYEEKIEELEEDFAREEIRRIETTKCARRYSKIIDRMRRMLHYVGISVKSDVDNDDGFHFEFDGKRILRYPSDNGRSFVEINGEECPLVLYAERSCVAPEKEANKEGRKK